MVEICNVHFSIFIKNSDKNQMFVLKFTVTKLEDFPSCASKSERLALISLN